MLYIPDRDEHDVDPTESFISLDEHPAGVMLKSASLVIIICAGTVENATVIYTIIKDKHLHRAPYYYMINLSIADLLKSLLCLPIALSTAMHGSAWSQGQAACKLMAFSSTFLTFGAVFALLILSIDRYMSVVYFKFHSKKFKGLMCLTMVLAGWATAFLLAFPPVFGLGTYRYIPVECQCSLDHRYFTDNDTLGFTMIFVAIMLLTLFIYVRVYKYLRAHRRMRPIVYNPLRSQDWTFFGPAGLHIIQPGQQVNNVNIQTNHDNTNIQQAGHIAWTNPLTQTRLPIPNQQTCITARFVSTVSPKNERLTRVFVTVSVLFDVMWIPYLIMCFWYMFDPDRSVPYSYATVATWISYGQVAMLPVVYFVGHAPFRKALGRSLESTSSMNGYTLREYRMDTEVYRDTSSY